MNETKFKLKKDLPNVKVGTIGECFLDGEFAKIHTFGGSKYTEEFIRNNPDWFEEIKEPEYNIGDYIKFQYYGRENYGLITKILGLGLYYVEMELKKDNICEHQIFCKVKPVERYIVTRRDYAPDDIIVVGIYLHFETAQRAISERTGCQIHKITHYEEIK